MRFVLVLALFASSYSFAQTEPQPQTTFGEEIEVRVIDVDVVVTDRQGNPITNLTRDDFELYESGKRVEIAYFSRIVDGRIADLPPPADGEQPVAAPRTPLTWVVYIDQTNLAPQRRNQAIRQLQTFLPRSIVGGDRGVIALNDGRSFKLRQGLTDDTNLLLETLAKIEKERVVLGAAINRANAIRNEISRADPADMHFVDVAQSIAHDISYVIEEEAHRTRNAILAMAALLDGLARLEGRVALVYVGAGFNTLPALQLVEQWMEKFRDYRRATWAPDPERHKHALEREVGRLYTNFSAMRVTVYAIDGGHPGGGPTTVEDAGNLQPSAYFDATRAEMTQAGLAREMAERTGGTYFKVSQALATQMEAVRRDLSNYYSLGYKPSGKAADIRRVRVKVNVNGARVRHRESVREPAQHERAASAVVASMVQPGVQQSVRRGPPVLTPDEITAANPLGVAVTAARPRPDGWTGDHHLPFDFTLLLDALTFTRRGNAYHADFVMHFALVGKDGSVYPLESREQSLSVPAEETTVAKKETEAVSYSWHVDLAPLRVPKHVPIKQDGMRLTVTVEDRASGVRSIVTVPVGKERA